jgi:hypothetical protein
MMLNEDSIFWPIYMTIMLFVFGIAYGSIITKTFMEKYKEYKLQKTLKINIQTLISTSSQDKPQQINNWKYNGPLLTGIQMVFLGTITFILGSLFHFFWFYVAVFSYIDDKMILYQTYIFRKFVLGFLFELVFPVMYLATRKDLQRYIILMLKNLL